MTRKRTKLELQPELMERIVEGIRQFGSVRMAAQYAGISDQTIWNYLERAASWGEGVFVELRQKVSHAQAEFMLRHIDLITRAAEQGTWQASAWLLERIFPEMFGRNRTGEFPDAPPARTVVILDEIGGDGNGEACGGNP